LLRPRLGDVAYWQENVALHDAARGLSALRDARTVLASLSLVEGEASDAKSALDRRRELLQVRLNSARKGFTADPVALYRFADRVADSWERVCAALENPGILPRLSKPTWIAPSG